MSTCAKKKRSFVIPNVEKNGNDTETLYTTFQLTAQFRVELHTLKMKASIEMLTGPLLIGKYLPLE